KGLDTLTSLGMVHELPHESLGQKAADLYLQWSKEGEVPVISPTWAQADDIAARIRLGLRARGDLIGPEVTVRKLDNLGWTSAQIKDARQRGVEGVVFRGRYAYTESTQSLAVGDKVRSTMKGRTKDGNTINSGQQHTIAGFTNTTIILNNGWEVPKDWG